MRNTVALGKVRLGIDRLASRYPLHAGILARWQVSETAAVPTAAVGFDSVSQTMRLIVEPGFVESLRMDELEGVLHHEVNHVLFEHVYHVPEPGEDRAARTVAEEVTANEYVPEPLPGEPILLAHYPFLKPREDTETRYRKLRGKVELEWPAILMPLGGGGSGEDGRCPGAPPQPGGKGSANPAPRAGGAAAGSVPTDSHAAWEEIRANAEAARAAADADIASAWAQMSAEQRDAVPEAVKAAVAEPCDGVGVAAGWAVSELDGGEGRVPWQKVLRRYAGRELRRRPVFGRPPRRYPELAGIIPGKSRHRDPPKVLAAIDTSGSMSDGTLSEISAELEKMSGRFNVTVVECDTVIHAVYPFRPIKTASGRGGTDLRPPLEPAFLKKQKADMVVYFTDGCGPAPAKPPAVPVIWCLTEGGSNRSGWGRVVKMGRGPDAGREDDDGGTL